MNCYIIAIDDFSFNKKILALRDIWAGPVRTMMNIPGYAFNSNRIGNKNIMIWI